MEYDFFKKFIDYFSSDSFGHLVQQITIIVLVYLLVLYIFIIPFFYLIFKRENIKPIYAFIPFYNIYVYLSFLNLLPTLAFAPIINVITVHFSISELARLYRCNKLIRLLAVILPPVALILIAINPKYSIANIYYRNASFLRTVEDVNELENFLENQPQFIMDEGGVVQQDKPLDDSYKSYIDNKVAEIEANAIKDDLDEDLMMLESNIKEEHIKEAQKKIEEEAKEEFIDSLEIQDLFENNDIRTNKIEDIVNKVEDATKVEVIDNADYKDVQIETKDVKNIAFGGIEQDDKRIQHAIESKDNSMYCPYCKSPLNGHTDSCPGCGKLLPK